MTLPYFKRPKIVAKLIEELAIDGPKRPTKINALQNYGSKQDQYDLLKELVKDHVLTRDERSHKNVRYSIDENVHALVKEISKTRTIHREALRKIPTLKLDKNEAVSYRIATLLFQLGSLLQAMSALTYYPQIYKPKTKAIMVTLIQGEVESALQTLKALAKNDYDATGQALKIVSKLLHETATNPEQVKGFLKS